MYVCAVNERFPDLSDLSISIFMVGNRRLAGGWGGVAYSDSFSRIYCVEEGEAFVRHSDREYILRPGRLYLIPEHTVMDYSQAVPFTLRWIHFRCRLFRDVDLFDLLPCRYETPVGEDESAVLHLFSLLQQAGATPERPTRDLWYTGLVGHLVSRFFLPDTEVEFSRRRRHLDRIRGSLDYIREHLDEKLTVGTLSSHMGMERTAYSRSFSAATGIPPAVYIRRKRVEEVKSLLVSTDMTLEEMAEITGFYDAFHLSKRFKEIVGISPREFRDRPFTPAPEV